MNTDSTYLSFSPYTFVASQYVGIKWKKDYKMNKKINKKNKISFYVCRKKKRQQRTHSRDILYKKMKN